MNTVITHAAILPCAKRDSFIESGFIEIEGNAIRRVASGEWDHAWQAPDIQTHDAQHKLIIPGLINGHTHLAMAIFKGLGEDLSVVEWLHRYIFPLEAKMVSSELVAIGTRLALLESIRAGVTAVADMYYFSTEVGAALDQAGLRGWVGQASMKATVPDAKNIQEGLKCVERLIERFSGHPRIVPTVAPHSPYSEDIETLKRVSDFAKQHGLLVQIHVSESLQEQAIVAERYGGLTPTQVVMRAGLHENPMVMAHGVYLSDADLLLLKQFRHVGIIYNPESNMKLGSGVAPLAKWLDAGIAVGLGTDGSCSNNDLDILGEMDVGAKLQKVHCRDASACSAETIFHIATLGNARAFGKAEEIGSIAVGKKADLTLIDLDRPHLVPMYDALSQVVYCAKAGDVSDVMVDGSWVMRDYRILTLDEAHIRKEARVWAKRIQKSIS